MTTPRIRRLGLTGGIGSGKSTVADLLVRQGAVLVDTDAIARRLTGPGGVAIAPLQATFGDGIIDRAGALDRDRMRELAFGDLGVRRRLEAVLHPMISAEAQRAAAAHGDSVIVFDVPLLSESSHWRSRVYRVVVVDCEHSTQVDRVVQRSGWQRDVVERVISQQSPRPIRRRCADAVIYNYGLSLHDLAVEVEALWRRWCVPA